MKKFFLISQVFYPDEVSTANLFTGLCKELVRKGVEVEVWAAQPSYTSSDKQAKRTNHEGISIQYLRSTRFHKSKIYGRALNIITFILSSSTRLLFSKDKTPVFTHTTPPFLGIVLSLVCLIKKRKFVYIMLDIFPEGLIRLDKLSRKNIFAGLWMGMFRRSLKRSDIILVLGRDMKEYIQNTVPQVKDRVEYLPHWQDENLIEPVAYKSNPFVSEHKLENQFVIQYSGNMGLWNDMATIGRAAARKPDGVKFLLIGGGIRKNELLQQIINGDQDNVLLLPFQPGNKLSEALSACHASIVSLREGLEGMAVPSKIYGILASGRPVIAMVPDKSEIAYIVKEEKCGIIVDPHDAGELINAIQELKNDDNLRNEMGVNARNAFENKYTTEIIARKYIDLIEELNT